MLAMLPPNHTATLVQHSLNVLTQRSTFGSGGRSSWRLPSGKSGLGHQGEPQAACLLQVRAALHTTTCAYMVDVKTQSRARCNFQVRAALDIGHICPWSTIDSNEMIWTRMPGLLQQQSASCVKSQMQVQDLRRHHGGHQSVGAQAQNCAGLQG